MEDMSKEGKEVNKKKELAVVRALKQLPLGEYVEGAIDFGSSDELISAVPVASTALGIFKAFKSYRHKKLQEKTDRFLKAASEGVSDDEVDSFVKEMPEELKGEFLEEVLDVIDRAECAQKAMILGTALRRMIKGDIDYQTFEDHVQFTNYIPLVNLHHFMHGYHNEYTLVEYLGDALVSQRLAERKITLVEVTPIGLSQKGETKIEVKYKITGIGRKYLETLHHAYYEKIEPSRRLV